MANPRHRAKRAGTKPSNDVNTIIKTANKNDRFKLLEDEAVLPANLTNTIHPIFHQLEVNENLHLALQLASHFLLHDKLLEFFVPLLYGHETHDLRSRKNYLRDPFPLAPEIRKSQLLADTRHALKCLADHTEIQFLAHLDGQTYARTVVGKPVSPVISSCCTKFQNNKAPRIELSDRFLKFYSDKDGYSKTTRCGQFRQDFLFAATLVHEVVHAVGVMRRGNLDESHYCLNYHETEWGYAWENFMFGCIINPQCKARPDTHLLMRKIWADANVAFANGGKEYCSVPMSWIAQWFRTETWNTVAEKGPFAIALPTTHFKVQISPRRGAWYVHAGEDEVREDMLDLEAQWQLQVNRLISKNVVPRYSTNIEYIHCTAAELETSNVPVPTRTSETARPALIQALRASMKHHKQAPQSAQDLPLLAATGPTVTVHRESSPCDMKRKRGAGPDIDEQPTSKAAKTKA